MTTKENKKLTKFDFEVEADKRFTYSEAFPLRETERQRKIFVDACEWLQGQQEKETKSDAPTFIRWIINKAKIDVISEDLIEVHAMGNEGMCPVLSPEELYEIFKTNPDLIPLPSPPIESIQPPKKEKI